MLDILDACMEPRYKNAAWLQIFVTRSYEYLHGTRRTAVSLNRSTDAYPKATKSRRRIRSLGTIQHVCLARPKKEADFNGTRPKQALSLLNLSLAFRPQ